MDPTKNEEVPDGKATHGLRMVFLVLATASLSVIAVSEMASRDSFAAFLKLQADSLRAEYVESSRGSSTSNSSTNRPASAQSGSSGSALPPVQTQIDLSYEIKKRETLDEIDATKRFESQVRILGALGAVAVSQTVEGIRRSFENYRLDRQSGTRRQELETTLARFESEARDSTSEISLWESRIKQIEPMIKSSAPVSAGAQVLADEVRDRTREHDMARSRLDTAVSQLANYRSGIKNIQESLALLKVDPPRTLLASLGAWQFFLWPFPWLNSDYLLALAIMACSALGALVSGLRTKEPTSVRDLTLGIASGFVCYFAIKGGKTVFLLGSHADLIPINPYGSAFAGLLVGLFSERVYELLNILVQDLEKRLTLAFVDTKGDQSKSSNANFPSAAQPVPKDDVTKRTEGGPNRNDAPLGQVKNPVAANSP